MTVGKREVLKLEHLINLERLKKYMEVNNISEPQFAKLINVDYSTVYRVLRGQRKPGAKFIAGLLNGNIKLNNDEFFLTRPLPSGNKN